MPSELSLESSPHSQIIYAPTGFETPLYCLYRESGFDFRWEHQFLWRIRLLARISLFQSEERGSKPLCATNLQTVILCNTC